VQAPEGYTTEVLQAPLPPQVAARVDRLLGHKGEPWVPDIRARLRGDGLDLFALAFRCDEPVANVWIGASSECPDLGVLGHVFTMPEHRRRGLAGRLLEASVRRFDELGGRRLQLHTGNSAARRLYEAAGFRVILEGESSEDGAGNWLMLRGGGEDGAGEAYHETSGEWAAEGYARRHYAALCVFLNVRPGTGKMPALGVDTGMDVEEKLLLAAQAQDRGEVRLALLIDAANGHPHGLACKGDSNVNVYAPRVSEQEKAVLRDHLRDL
jgi:GNAT superfamily N-acetyltransferase